MRTRADEPRLRGPQIGSGRHGLIALGPWAFRFERRGAAVYAALVVAIVVVGLFAMTLGDYDIGVGQVIGAVFEHTSDPLADYFVTGVRAPRIVAAVLVGAALGISGSIFQTISGNPLGSPDIIGFSTGAATGALVQIIAFNAGATAVSLGALGGGLAAAALVYVLAWRNGVAGFRLVLVGIGLAAALHAVNSLLVVKASLSAAQTAEQWLAGSLNGQTWMQVDILAVSMAVLVPAAAVLFRPLGVMPLGDELGIGLGIRVQHARLGVVVVGVGLAALATAATGPVAFVALAAPHLVRRLSHSAGPVVAGSALMGALLVLVSDIVAQRLFAPTQLAVGTVTGSLGGVYLIALLALEWKKHRG